MKLRILTLAAVVLAATAVTPAGLRAEDEGPISREKASLIVNMKERIELEMFLKAMDVLLDAELVWDPQDKAIRGKSIIAGGNLEMQPETLLDEMRGLLTFYDLVMVPVGETKPEQAKRFLVMDARRTSAIARMKAEYVELDDTTVEALAKRDGHYVTTSIRVEHMRDLRSARSALQRLVTMQNIGNVTEVPGSRTFIITDFAPNVAAIYRLVKDMDAAAGRSTRDLVVKTVELKHGQCGPVCQRAGVALPRARDPAPSPGAQRRSVVCTDSYPAHRAGRAHEHRDRAGLARTRRRGARHPDATGRRSAQARGPTGRFRPGEPRPRPPRRDRPGTA